jgi:hypothetical protein
MRIDGLAVQFTVVYYRTVEGREPIRDFLDRLRSSQPILHDLLAAGLEKLADSANHHRPLTELVDRKDRIWEVRVGRTNIARIFWCFGQERREIVDLRGYVKHGQALDRGELDRARAYKHDLERRTP